VTDVTHDRPRSESGLARRASTVLRTGQPSADPLVNSYAVRSGTLSIVSGSMWALISAGVALWGGLIGAWPWLVAIVAISSLINGGLAVRCRHKVRKLRRRMDLGT
jgi:fatty acid desaturase